MIDIEKLRKYYINDAVLVSAHTIMCCLSCKMEEMEESTNVYFATLSNCYVIIENVPCYKCPQCGEVFYKSSVIEKIDEIIDKLENITSKVFIVDYKEAA